MDAASWQQAKDVIAEALRRTPSDRETFVRSRCTNPEVADEILTLLAGMTGPHELDALDAVGATDDGPLEPPDGDADDLAPGTRVGPYVIVEPIGRGGMGRVFLGSDPRLRRKVALKCVLRTLADDRNARILHEARAAARVTHPNVATIHDVIEHENRAFIVMEYVEGESLAARLKRERIPVERVLAIGRQLASALSAAHAKGVIHRDLKPANIQLTPDGGVKVLDFGIANAPRVATSVASTISTHRAPTPEVARAPQPGTPPYMAPEQLLGRSADERSDIFSLGVVLYEMATGRRPFTQTETADLVMAHAKGAPRADRIDRAVPRPLADILARALSFDPKARFQTAADLGAALESIERTHYHARLRSRQKVRRAALSSIGAVLGITFLGVVNSAVYNLVLGRTGTFANDSLLTYLRWGALSLTGPCLLLLASTLLGWVLFAAAKLASTWRPLSRTVNSITDKLSRSGLQTLTSSSVLVPVIAIGGTLTLAFVFWDYGALIQSWFSYIDSSPHERFSPLNPEMRLAPRFRFSVAVLTVAMAALLVSLLRLRAREGVTDGRPGVYAVAALVAIYVLLNSAPYRVFYNTTVERIERAGQRCYMIGEDQNRLLLNCPDLDPPRNRIVSKSDASLHFVGVKESIFSQRRDTTRP